MKVILSPTCKSLTGSLGRGFGYFIVRRKNGFFGVRSRHNVPPDGHWRFILACAELAKMKQIIARVVIQINAYLKILAMNHVMIKKKPNAEFVERK